MVAKPLVIDSAVFDPANAEPELVAINADIIALQKARPSPWSLPLEAVRQARREGRGIFPPVQPDRLASRIWIEARDRHAIPLRVFRPTGREAAGTFLHFHGGGWVFGEAAEGDPFLRQLADRTGLAVVSVDYRLAPEHPYPTGPDDGEDAALALIHDRLVDADGALPQGFLAIGGESAGAHLAVLTLLRLRDRHGLTPFHAANLNAGCYDLSMTPSVRSFGAERLVLNSEDVATFVRHFVPPGLDPRSPEISPLHAALHGLPPAFFTCGTRDLLIDDTLFLASRWLAAGNEAELSLHAGGCHVFQAFPSATGTRSTGEMEDFLRRKMAEGPALQRR
ncbi:esterase [Aureimonas sp. SA4125]|uniref:alpha/beta hydrolase n=1 Tax=Aureimonas sp. SA4125 TaxID=2826993 RepID=UPI001CC769E7|nr:alpha/beta hydrolase [Aureimonas sp. SA4125]BDA83410.1 esterase [Aureimonas sp. SA4125]